MFFLLVFPFFSVISYSRRVLYTSRTFLTFAPFLSFFLSFLFFFFFFLPFLVKMFFCPILKLTKPKFYRFLCIDLVLSHPNYNTYLSLFWNSLYNITFPKRRKWKNTEEDALITRIVIWEEDKIRIYTKECKHTQEFGGRSNRNRKIEE